MLKANFASLMETSSNVSSNANISIAEAGLIAVQGMIIVFSVLVILMIVLNIMKFFSKEDSVETKAAVNAAPAKAATTDETLAVISATVAAMSGDDPTKRLRVVSVQEQSTGKYVWKK